jgi:hypothetical protein
MAVGLEQIGRLRSATLRLAGTWMYTFAERHDHYVRAEKKSIDELSVEK